MFKMHGLTLYECGGRTAQFASPPRAERRFFNLTNQNARILFLPINRPRSLKTNFCCFRRLRREKLVRNDMSHVVLSPRIKKFTAV